MSAGHIRLKGESVLLLASAIGAAPAVWKRAARRKANTGVNFIPMYSKLRLLGLVPEPVASFMHLRRHLAATLLGPEPFKTS